MPIALFIILSFSLFNFQGVALSVNSSKAQADLPAEFPVLRKTLDKSVAIKYPSNEDLAQNSNSTASSNLDLSDLKKQFVDNQIFNPFNPLEEIEENDDDHKNIKITYDPEKIIYDETQVSNFNITPLPGSPTQTNIPTNIIGFSSSSLPFGAGNVDPDTVFSLTFDTVPSEEILKKLTFYPEANFTYSITGNKINIQARNLDLETDYIFGLKSQTFCNTYFNPNESVEEQKCDDKIPVWYYAFTFKTNYRVTREIGKTVQNRSILAHFYGKNQHGRPKFLLSGATHGEEWRSGGLWILVDYLNNNPSEIIGKGKQIIIVPEINIDGALVNKNTGIPNSQAGRNNSRGVNLNRNYPIDWKPCSNCGAYAGSEPEVQAMINLTTTHKPNYLITYHAQWPPRGIIFLGSDASNQTTYNWAKWVADRTGYPIGVYDGHEVAEVDAVPGDQAVWSESVGVSSLLIEATYRTNTDYDKNFPMYLQILRSL
jgi:hypothetical protein